MRGFGLYDPDASVFVDERLPDRALTCVACESGRFSKRIRDDRGITYQCALEGKVNMRAAALCKMNIKKIYMIYKYDYIFSKQFFETDAFHVLYRAFASFSIGFFSRWKTNA